MDVWPTEESSKRELCDIRNKDSVVLEAIADNLDGKMCGPHVVSISSPAAHLSRPPDPERAHNNRVNKTIRVRPSSFVNGILAVHRTRLSNALYLSNESSFQGI